MATELMRRPWTGTDLTREPFRELVPLRTMMDRLLESAFAPSWWSGWFGEGLAGTGMDLYETDEAYTVHCLLPGIDPDAVQVSVQDNVLTISGESQRPAPQGARAVFQEIGYGTFQRQVTLGTPVEADKAEATYHHGILSITVPKAAASRRKTIKVHAKAA